MAACVLPGHRSNGVGGAEGDGCNEPPIVGIVPELFCASLYVRWLCSGVGTALEASGGGIVSCPFARPIAIWEGVGATTPDGGVLPLAAEIQG